MAKYILSNQVNFYVLGVERQQPISFINTEIDFKIGELIYSSMFKSKSNSKEVHNILDNIPIFEIDKIIYSHYEDDVSKVAKFIYLKQFFGNIDKIV